MIGHHTRAARAAQREAILVGLDWFMEAQLDRITACLSQIETHEDGGPYLGRRDCDWITTITGGVASPQRRHR